MKQLTFKNMQQSGVDIKGQTNPSTNLASTIIDTKPCARPDTHAHRRPNNDCEPRHTQRPWIEMYQISDFEKLHKQIYHQVEAALQDNDDIHHPYYTKWNKLKTHGNKYVLTDKMTWRTMKLCLAIDDIHQYKDFIHKCPNIDNYIILKTNTKLSNTLDFSIKERPGKTPFPTTMPLDDNKSTSTKQSHTDTSLTSSIPSTKPKDTLGSRICTERTQDVQHFLTILLPILETYITTQPQDKYTLMYRAWFDNHTTFTANFPI